jgi:competence protein ComEC
MSPVHRLVLAALAATLAACSGVAGAPDEASSDEADTALTASTITARQISAASDLPATAPAYGRHRVHMIDVGTGLSILVQGHDFTMLYDGGSSDDSRGITQSAATSGNESRLLAYLFATVGPSGGPECVPQGDQWKAGSSFPERTIDHLVLSHAHRDHLSMLGDVLHCYAVKNVWEPGALYDQQGYNELIAAVLAEPGVHYHTAATPPAELPTTWLGAKVPAGFQWSQFAENDQVTLGRSARFKVLHVDPDATLAMANNSSVVLKVTLRSRTLLLMGDAQGGVRESPDSTVNSVEKEILAAHASELDADLFQIGHHGSATSSRHEFLDAVFPEATSSADKPRWGMLSVGPTPYAGVVLPDRSIVDQLTDFRPGLKIVGTNLHDRVGGPGNPGTCPTADRVGVDDEAPGGCDNFVFDIGP